jgi:hypothetical protein
VSGYRWVGFFAVGFLFASLPPQIEARKLSTKKAAHKEQHLPLDRSSRAPADFLDRSNLLRAKSTGVTMNSPESPPFIGSLAVKSHQRPHAMRKAVLRQIPTVSILPALNRSLSVTP